MTSCFLSHAHSCSEEIFAGSSYSSTSQLDKNIDLEIHQEALKIAKQTAAENELMSVTEEGDQVPFDPNLVCFKCGRQFRLGEIQKYKKHVSSCSSALTRN